MSTAAASTPSPDRILQTALQLFSEKGYDATSVREICEAAGITKPTLYHFYGSKEGVYRKLVHGTFEQYRQGVKERVEAPATLDERLRSLARGHFEYTREHPSLVRFLLGLIHHPPSSAPATDFPRLYAEIVGEIARMVDRGVAEGTLTKAPTDVRMLVFMGAIGEALHGYLIAGRPDLTPELADTLVRTVLDGWRSAPRPERA
jgi:AcrR family transcriptional regulator